MKDVPASVLALTVWAYWLCVGVLSLWVLCRTRKLAGIVPSQRIEQLMGLVWIPLVAAWLVLPYLAATRVGSRWSLPEFALRAPYVAVRGLAAALAVICLALSIDCWRRMGTNWRMAVAPGRETELVTSGLYSRVRHPIYALSILLMLATVVVVPTLIVATMAAIHIALMISKSYNEERFLGHLFGARYRDYHRTTGRLLPRWNRRWPGRFNLFQRMMLRWSELHPYNPVHVVQIRHALDEQRLRDSIVEQLRSASLAALAIDRDHWRFRFEDGRAAVDLMVIPGADDAIGILTSAIERELSLPFAATTPVVPFRFRAIDTGEAFHLALVYDHFVADGNSIARLLTAIACSYIGADAPPASFDLYPRTYRHLLARRPIATLRAALALPRLVASARRGFRPPCTDASDMTNAFACFRLDDRQTQALNRTRKDWGVTLNDLLLAVLLQAFLPQFPDRRSARRRTELAVASILNMRGDFQTDNGRAFGPFLAAFRIGHPMPAGIDLRSIAMHVHDASARVRRRHRYLKSILALSVSALLWRFLTLGQRGSLYAKHYPTVVGLTMLDVDAIWSGSGCTDGLDYLRAAPTGPLCPMVFAVTKVHDRLNVSVAFRPATYSRQVVDDITAEFRRCVDRLAVEALQ